MSYQYKDVEEFQTKYPTRMEKAEALEKMNDDEIWHLVETCTTQQGRIYYSSFMKDPDKYRR